MSSWGDKLGVVLIVGGMFIGYCTLFASGENIPVSRFIYVLLHQYNARGYKGVAGGGYH
jgi:hypothetical protein